MGASRGQLDRGNTTGEGEDDEDGGGVGVGGLVMVVLVLVTVVNGDNPTEDLRRWEA